MHAVVGGTIDPLISLVISLNAWLFKKNNHAFKVTVSAS